MANPTDATPLTNPNAQPHKHIEEEQNQTAGLGGPMQATADTTQNEQSPLLPFEPDLKRLASAMCCLPPNCDAATFAYRRIAPIARDARIFPELAEQLRQVASSWCGGGVRFERVWQHFINQKNYNGPQTTLGTIYHAAKAAGWVYQPTDLDE